MAHKWKSITLGGAAWSGNKRKCVNCDAIQTHACIGGDRLNGWRYGWRPLVGRCITDGAGRPRRQKPKAKPIWCGQGCTGPTRELVLTLTPAERLAALMEAAERKKNAE